MTSRHPGARNPLRSLPVCRWSTLLLLTGDLTPGTPGGSHMWLHRSSGLTAPVRERSPRTGKSLAQGHVAAKSQSRDLNIALSLHGLTQHVPRGSEFAICSNHLKSCCSSGLSLEKRSVPNSTSTVTVTDTLLVQIQARHGAWEGEAKAGDPVPRAPPQGGRQWVLLLWRPQTSFQAGGPSLCPPLPAFKGTPPSPTPVPMCRTEMRVYLQKTKKKKKATTIISSERTSLHLSRHLSE